MKTGDEPSPPFRWTIRSTITSRSRGRKCDIRPLIGVNSEQAGLCQTALDEQYSWSNGSVEHGGSKTSYRLPCQRPTGTRVAHNGCHDPDLLSWPAPDGGNRIVLGLPRVAGLRRSPAAPVPVWRGKTDLRQLSRSLLRARVAGAHPHGDALLRPAHALASPGACPAAHAGQPPRRAPGRRKTPLFIGKISKHVNLTCRLPGRASTS